MDFERLLTHGTVKSIMNKEEVQDPVIQIIGFRKLTAEGKDERYRLLISDGQNYNSFVLLSIKLNGMIHSGEITEFVIVKLKAYNFATVTITERRKQILVILDLRVLRYGYAVGFKIGNPMPFANSSVKVVEYGSKTLNSATERNHSKIIKYDEILTKGSLNSIRKKEEVKDPVIQILDTRKIFDVGEVQRYRLLISDGQNLSSLALLGRQLNRIIYSGELTQFSIVQVKNYLMCDISEYPIIIITDVDVLINGHRVGSKIGDPKLIINNSYQGIKYGLSESVIDEISFDSLEIYKDSDRLFIMEYEQMLTTGSLESIINNEIIESSMQVLKIEKIINCWNNTRYRLLLSDGHISSSFIMLGSALNDMVTTGKLNQFSIIQIKNHTITELTTRDPETNINVMIISDLCVLVSGKLVGLKIGEPKLIIISPENDTEDYNDVLSKSFDIFPV